MKIFVHLWYSLDAVAYHLNFDKGRSSDRTPYGYHHAADDPKDHVEFSKSAAEGALASVGRRALAVILGFDLIHLLRNRQAAAAADVVWCHTEREAVALTFWFKVVNRSFSPKLLLQSVWLMDGWDNLNPVRRWIFKNCLRRADALTFLSPLNKDAARTFEVEKTLWVPFGISTEVFPLIEPVERNGSRSSPGTKFKLLSVGNDIHRDWECLVEAFGNDDRFELRVASSRFPKSLLEERKIRNFTVAATNTLAELRGLYASCDILVLPLKPNLHVSGMTVLLEAVTQGIPILSSRVGGLDAYFSDDEVSFVVPGMAEELRNKTLELLTAPAQAVQQARNAQARFLADDYSSRGYALRQVAISRELIES